MEIKMLYKAGYEFYCKLSRKNTSKRLLPEKYKSYSFVPNINACPQRLLLSLWLSVIFLILPVPKLII